MQTFITPRSFFNTVSRANLNLKYFYKMMQSRDIFMSDGYWQINFLRKIKMCKLTLL